MRDQSVASLFLWTQSRTRDVVTISGFDFGGLQTAQTLLVARTSLRKREPTGLFYRLELATRITLE